MTPDREGGGGASVTVRLALEEELAAAGACVRAAYDADGLADAEYGAVLADARARAETADVLVAVDAGGSVLGSVTFSLPGSPWADLAQPGEAELRMLGVAPSARGSGVAAMLVQACVTRAEQAGARRAVLCSQVAMTAAHRLYLRHGFARAPELDWQVRPGLSLLGFARDLTAPST